LLVKSEKLKLKNIATLSLTSSPANLSRGTVWTNRRPDLVAVFSRSTASAINQFVMLGRIIAFVGIVLGNWTQGAAEGAG